MYRQFLAIGSRLTRLRVTPAHRAETVLVRRMRGITTILTRHGPLNNDRVQHELTARMPCSDYKWRVS